MDNLTDAEQGKVIELAVRSRKSVKKSEEEERSRKRQQNLVDSHMKREAARQKLLLEKEKLSHVQLVTSSKKLKRCLCEIDAAQEISQTYSDSINPHTKRITTDHQIIHGNKKQKHKS